MTKRAKPARASARWTPQEDSALLLGVNAGTPVPAIAQFLRRPVNALFKRLHTHHHDAWMASGHPQCHHWKSEGKARAAARREAVQNAPVEAEIMGPPEPQLRLVPDPATVVQDLPPWAAGLLSRLREQEAEIGALRDRVAHLESEWGIEA